MASLQCEICGGKLIIQSGGICECYDCGMMYDKERVKEMVMAMHSTSQKEDDETLKNVPNTNADRATIDQMDAEESAKKDDPARELIDTSSQEGTRHLRAILFVQGMVEKYCEQFNSSHRGKQLWDSIKEQYHPLSTSFKLYFFIQYALERAKYKSYEKYWKDYLTGKANRTDIRDLVQTANQSIEVQAVMGNVSAGNYQELADEFDFPYSDIGYIDSFACVHMYYGQLIQNELVLNYISQLNSNNIFKELSVEEALSYMRFTTTDDYMGDISMQVVSSQLD